VANITALTVDALEYPIPAPYNRSRHVVWKRLK
jgi:hypothetical protein